MPHVIVAVDHRTPFQGEGQEFSTAYRYDAPSVEEADLRALADLVIALERPIYANTVTFVGVKVWDAGVPPNYMRLSEPRNLVGTGGAASTYPECAWLVQWPLPRKFGIRKAVSRSLKKWHHAQGLPFGGDARAQVATQPTQYLPNVASYLTLILEPKQGYFLCAPDGDRPSGPAVVAPFLEHRQFHRGKKRKDGGLP